jgi:hypothetical protein
MRKEENIRNREKLDKFMLDYYEDHCPICGEELKSISYDDEGYQYCACGWEIH